MRLHFDLISDLHVETWPEKFNWQGKSTSMLCVVAGDISEDRATVIETLKHLSTCYRTVLYIDGNDEHQQYIQDIGDSYRTLDEEISKIPNVVYLHDNLVIIDGVAFVGSNGWWTYDFNSDIEYDQARRWFQEHYNVDSTTVSNVETLALQDYAYLTNSIKKMQTYQDVKRIVVVTHTVPSFEFIEHDVDLSGTYRQNMFGNSFMRGILAADTEEKIDTWCFGHYHGSVDATGHGIRYVNNCRGKGDTPWKVGVYHPLRITINY